MCLAIPGLVLSIDGDDPLSREARVAFGGVIRRVNVAFTPEVATGTYVLVHAGFAIAVIDAAEAERTVTALETAAVEGA